MSSAAAAEPKGRPEVALVLSGCGYADGAEVTEAVAAMVHLGRGGAAVSFFAPDADQMHVVNHNTGEVDEHDKRSALVEAARITRGNVAPLEALRTEALDAVVFVGGFGAAKNLSTFATDGTDMVINAEVERAIRECYDAKKPVGLCCIAPVLAANVLGDKVAVTVGHEEEEDGRWPYAGTSGAIKFMGARHVPKDLNEAHVDEAARVVTAPAYMANAQPHEVFDSVGKMVDGVLALVASPPQK